MNFVTFQSVPYIEHVDAEVLCDEVRNLLLQINQIMSGGGHCYKFKKSRYFERLTKYERFMYLLKQLDGSSLLDIVRQMLPLTRTSDRERTLCVCVCVGVCKHVRMCVSICDCVYVCMIACIRVCVCACVLFYFIIHKYVLHASSLNNKVLFLYKCICYPSRAGFCEMLPL